MPVAERVIPHEVDFVSLPPHVRDARVRALRFGAESPDSRSANIESANDNRDFWYLERQRPVTPGIRPIMYTAIAVVILIGAVWLPAVHIKDHFTGGSSAQQVHSTNK